MYGNEFQIFFNKLPYIKKNFKGVYPLNYVPKDLKKNEFIIINTAFSNHPGKHWFLIYKNLKGTLEIFDSLGFNKKCFKYIKHLGKKLEINARSFMRSSSKICGEFVTYFIINRLFHPVQKYESFLKEIFSNNKFISENKVKSFLRKINNE